jgi:hypothetical protein
VKMATNGPMMRTSRRVTQLRGKHSRRTWTKIHSCFLRGHGSIAQRDRRTISVCIDTHSWSDSFCKLLE